MTEFANPIIMAQLLKSFIHTSDNIVPSFLSQMAVDLPFEATTEPMEASRRINKATWGAKVEISSPGGLCYGLLLL